MDPRLHPSLDEHLVRDETREEMVRGRLTLMPAAEQPAARQHTLLGFVIRAHIAPGYVSSTHLLTRAGPTSEFSTSVCVRRAGVDPSTRTRYLEELAFQIVTEHWPLDLTERAEDLSKRGVRRFLAIFVERGEIAEWSATRGQWMPLSPDATLDDPTLVRPVPIRALFDSAMADDEVIEALALKGNPRLAQILADAYAQGRLEGRLQRVVTALCEVLDIPIGPSESSHMQTLDPAGLETLLTHIKINRRWPTT